MLHEQGFQDGTRVLSAELVAPTPQVREILRIPAGNPVVSLLRLRFADGDTLSLERMYLRGVQPILGTALTSIYETLRSEFGITIAATEESIELASATAQTGGLLDQPVNTALLRLERIGYDQGDSPVEYSVDLFRADRTRLSVRTRG
ncbi:GntR family transcriptional regulator [Rhodococcus ruber]|nr:GntR family transcriptional regulator [Rhodococcus ruber]